MRGSRTDGLWVNNVRTGLTTTAPQIASVSQLVEELQLYWSLLEMAVRLDRDWGARLRAARDDAVSAAITLGQRIAGEDSQIGTLADLRDFIAGKIECTAGLASVTLATVQLDVVTVSVARNAINEARDIGELLARGVNIRDCSCTGQRAARRELMGHLLRNPATDPFVDSAHQLTRLACAEVTQRLRKCIEACAKWGDPPVALH